MKVLTTQEAQEILESVKEKNPEAGNLELIAAAWEKGYHDAAAESYLTGFNDCIKTISEAVQESYLKFKQREKEEG